MRREQLRQLCDVPDRCLQRLPWFRPDRARPLRRLLCCLCGCQPRTESYRTIDYVVHYTVCQRCMRRLEVRFEELP